MHNNIMVAGSRDRLSMLPMRRHAQWQLRFLRYIDTRSNGDAPKTCILEGPYTPSTVIISVVPATDDSSEVPERTAVETILNMSPKNKEHYQTEKEAIHLLLTGIEDEIYSTVDACKTAHDMWIAIERLQQINKIRAERIAKNANTLALVAAAQQYTDPYYQASKSHKPYAPPSKQSSSTRSYAFTKYKDKEIAKPITPSSESTSEEDNTFSRYKNDNQTGQFRNQSTVTAAGARDTVGSQETKKGKKNYTNHKERMLLCKQAKKGVPLQAKQGDWLEDTDKEIDEQELKAHYSYMEKIQEVPIADSGTDTKPLEHVQYTGQNAKERDDERVALANLIVNLNLDVDENKKIQKQLKKANTSLAHELKECKSNLEESNTTRDSCLIALQCKQTELETYKSLNDHTVDYDKLKRKLNETL
ncbi:hypothetical protein Tco_0661041 [Tanacetum coccineum]